MRRRWPLIPVALAVLCAPAAASADTITLDHGAAKLAAFGNLIPIVDPGDPVEIENVAYGPGDVFSSSAAADFDFPAFSGTDGGIDFTVDMEATAPVAGSFDRETGAMTTDPVSYTATLTLGPPDNATCTYAATLAFSTANAGVPAADPFDPGDGPPANGAISSAWSGVTADPAPGCARFNQYAGAGSFWFSNGIELPDLGPVAPPGGGPVPLACPKSATARSRCGCKKRGVLKKGKCVKKKPKKKRRRKR